LAGESHGEVSSGSAPAREGHNQQPDNDTAHKRDETIRKRIGEALILTVYVVFDFRDEWPKNHISALILGVIAISSILLIELRWKKWAVVTIVLVITAAIILRLSPPVLPEETDYHGWLLPANDPVPKTACTPQGDDAHNMGWFFVTLAGGGVYTHTDKLDAITIGDHPTIRMERGPQGLLVDVDMLNANGALLVRIEKNEWRVIPTQAAYVRRPDRSTLVAYDLSGREMLWLRYMNPGLIKIRGTFYKVGDPTPIVVSDDAIQMHQGIGLYMAPMNTLVGFVPCFIVGTDTFNGSIFTFK
jgi:hypothetical protein